MGLKSRVFNLYLTGSGFRILTPNPDSEKEDEINILISIIIT